MDLWSAGVCALEAVVLSSPLTDRYLKLQQPLGDERSMTFPEMPCQCRVMVSSVDMANEDPLWLLLVISHMCPAKTECQTGLFKTCRDHRKMQVVQVNAFLSTLRSGDNEFLTWLSCEEPLLSNEVMDVLANVHPVAWHVMA